MTRTFSIYFRGDDLIPQGREERSDEETIPLFASPPLREDSKALILSIEVPFASNDYDEDILVEISNLFPVKKSDSSHPDNNGGRCSIVIGARFKGQLFNPYHEMYQPNLVNLGVNICTYAGIEDHILNARSTVISGSVMETDDYECYRETDPIVVFLVTHSYNMTDFVPADMLPVKDMTEPRCFMLSKKIVKRVKRFFRNTVFPLFNYTTLEHARIGAKRMKEDGDRDGKFKALFIVIQIQYILIKPTIPAYKAKTTLLRK